MNQTTDTAEAPVAELVEETALALSKAFHNLLTVRRDEPSWMRHKREAAWEEFLRLPMPKPSDEAWRRTDIRSLDLKSFARGLEEKAPEEPMEGKPRGVALPLKVKPADQNAVVHASGSGVYVQLRDDLVRQGVILTDLDTAVRKHQDLVSQYYLSGKVVDGAKKFAALHGAFCSGGNFLYVPPNVEVEVPLQAVLSFRKGQVVDCSHTLVIADENSRVTFVEELTSRNGKAPGLHVGGLEVFVGSGAKVRFGHIQSWGGNVWNFAVHRAYLGRDAELKWVSGLWGGRTSKVFQEVELRERGGNAEMLGILLGRGQQHMDYETFQDHQAPDTRSDLLYKGTLTGRSRSVWRGMIRVAPGANGTDAYQVNNNLLLDRRARADSIPGLEIEANEVRCTHGATAGQVDADQLFYLQSRGIDAEVATRLIVEGFFEPVFQRIDLEAVERRLKRAVSKTFFDG
jgi:Fe-S cluster assembly protein SufD